MEMTTPQEQQQEQDAGSLIPGLLALYASYLAYRSAFGALPTAWTQVVTKLQLPTFVGDTLAMIAARALTEQRAGLGPVADSLWHGAKAGVQAGTTAGLQVIAEALLWTEEQETEEGVLTKDSGGVVPTVTRPPVDLAMTVAQAVANVAQMEAAKYAGWRYKIWHTVGDGSVRESHTALNNTRVLIPETFMTPDGVPLRYPGDPAAPFDERIGCRCTLQLSR